MRISKYVSTTSVFFFRGTKVSGPKVALLALVILLCTVSLPIFSELPTSEVKAEDYLKTWVQICESANIQNGITNATFCPCVGATDTGATDDVRFGAYRIERLSQSLSGIHDLTDERFLEGLDAGGHWAPSSCRPREKVAIVVPYRNRAKHLSVFLPYMHSFLQHQNLEYQIFVIEQVSSYNILNISVLLQ
jgi:hypothetical protein